MPALGVRRRKRPNGIIERSRSRIERSSAIVSWHNYGVWTESAKFGCKAAFGVDLEIEEGGSHGSARAEREQNDEQPATVGTEKPADDAPEHGSIGCVVV